MGWNGSTTAHSKEYSLQGFKNAVLHLEIARAGDKACNGFTCGGQRRYIPQGCGETRAGVHTNLNQIHAALRNGFVFPALVVVEHIYATPPVRVFDYPPPTAGDNQNQ